MIGKGEDPRGALFEIANAAGEVLLRVSFDEAIGSKPTLCRRPASPNVAIARERAVRARRLAVEVSEQVELAKGNLIRIRAIVAGIDELASRGVSMPR